MREEKPEPKAPNANAFLSAAPTTTASLTPKTMRLFMRVNLISALDARISKHLGLRRRVGRLGLWERHGFRRMTLSWAWTPVVIGSMRSWRRT